MSVETEADEAYDDEMEDEEWDSDDEGAGQIAKLALGVDIAEIGNYDGKSAPINGSQYLLSVIKEAKKSPQVVVAEIKATTKKTNDSLPNSTLEDDSEGNQLNPIFLPNAEWEALTITEFSNLRSGIDGKRSLIDLGRVKIAQSNTPEKGNVVLWFKYCFGTRLVNFMISKPKKSQYSQSDVDGMLESFLDLSVDSSCILPVQEDMTDEIEDGNEEQAKSDIDMNDGNRPMMRIILCLPQRVIEFLIGCHLNWLKKYGLFNVRQGEWIYALLACVQKPLEPSTVSDIRSICKSCIFLRNKFCELKSQNHVNSENINMSEKELEYLNTLNLFICLVTNYFGQRDLV